MSENKTLFAQVLPDRPPPYPGECLSGYLVRLAEANGFRVFWDFVRDLFPRWESSSQIALLRYEYPVDDWGRISLRTQISPAQLRALSVAPWLEKFRPPITLSRPGYFSPGHWLRGVVCLDLHVCPACLEEAPYVRLLWRLMPTQVCLTHACWLQTQCSQCGATLRVTSPRQRHLHCAKCGMDLRRLPAVPAPVEVITAQTQRQANLQFLLDPETQLIKPVSTEIRLTAQDLLRAIGRKFCYLRERAGLSVGEVSRQLGVTPGMVCLMEKGRQLVLIRYLEYLEALSMSWADFTMVDVPVEFSVDQVPKLLFLRVCPNAECSNHQIPSRGVRVKLHFPERRTARFHCTSCGRNFTRRYDDGERVPQRQKASHRPEYFALERRPEKEVTRLLELGRQGMSDAQIASILGWSCTAVRLGWIKLNVIGEIRQAQVARRIREQQARNAALRERAEQVLQAMLGQPEIITFARVKRALRCSIDRLQTCPGLVERIREVAHTHNEHVRQHREEILSAQLMDAFAELKQRGNLVRIGAVLGRVGLIPRLLEVTHPQLYAMVRQVVGEHNAHFKMVRQQKQCVQINEAATRLVARGVRLTYHAILNEAGVGRRQMEADPVIRELLDHWVGDASSRV